MTPTGCAAPPDRSGSHRPPSWPPSWRRRRSSGSSTPPTGWTIGEPRPGPSCAGWQQRYSPSKRQRRHPLPLRRRLCSPPLRRPPPSAAPELPLEDATDIPEVIVVEDDPALAELLSFGLEARGYRFRQFRNGREALDVLKGLNTAGATPPLLLLDVDLPALDGYSIFDELQRDCPGKYRVVFTTVHGSEAEQLRGLEAGAIDYMVKPMSLRVALEKIRRWVGR